MSTVNNKPSKSDMNNELRAASAAAASKREKRKKKKKVKEEKEDGELDDETESQEAMSQNISENNNEEYDYDDYDYDEDSKNEDINKVDDKSDEMNVVSSEPTAKELEINQPKNNNLIKIDDTLIKNYETLKLTTPAASTVLQIEPKTVLQIEPKTVLQIEPKASFPGTNFDLIEDDEGESDDDDDDEYGLNSKRLKIDESETTAVDCKTPSPANSNLKSDFAAKEKIEQAKSNLKEKSNSKEIEDFNDNESSSSSTSGLTAISAISSDSLPISSSASCGSHKKEDTLLKKSNEENKIDPKNESNENETESSAKDDDAKKVNLN